MVKVHVYLYASLRQFHAGAGSADGAEAEAPDGTSIAGLYALLGIPAEEVKQAFINGRQRDPNYLLRDGDRVGVFPPIAGG
ncbi:MAG TPA: MoaD/ThiS family protein [Bacillota bacterium]